VRIVGVSFDPPSDTARWVENQAFPFEVWTDTNRTLAMAYGAAASPDATHPARMTVLLDQDADLALTYGSVSVQSHPEDVLQDAVALFGEAATTGAKPAAGDAP
jgi:peroxiredoxin